MKTPSNSHQQHKQHSQGVISYTDLIKHFQNYTDITLNQSITFSTLLENYKNTNKLKTKYPKGMGDFCVAINKTEQQRNACGEPHKCLGQHLSLNRNRMKHTHQLLPVPSEFYVQRILQPLENVIDPMAHSLPSLEKRVQCVRLLAKMDNITAVCRVMEATYGPPASMKKTFARINKSFDETGNVVNRKRPG
ncbi:uncharacterized protein LOC115216776 [Octopus sinensis]|uniref:Uncharacterized protein LOC115216776 n=1 Tax=Octopus sinensis TaxID=2607531 RepID=A0A7E6F4A4_9MOLL|nr:uncharacterized protein LOC115216776 [Octopus sinensis]XP_036362616.1 uncharacterized protein LOC115216776 [Octopus sinensis]